MKAIILALFSALLITPAHAAEQLIMVATTDADHYVTKFYAITDAAANLTGMAYESNDPDNRGESFTFKQVTTSEVVVKRNKAHAKDVVWLTGPKLTTTDGGNIRMTYLQNGMTGSTGSFTMEVHRVGSKWVLYTDHKSGSRPFTKMFMKASTFLGKVIGIEEIQTED